MQWQALHAFCCSLLELVNTLQQQAYTAKYIPQICVVGGQSDGKSTMLNRITAAYMPEQERNAFKFLPEHFELGTRCPLVVQMVQKITTSGQHEAKLTGLHGNSVYKFVPIQQEGDLLSFGQSIADAIWQMQNDLLPGSAIARPHQERITLELHGPKLPTLSLVDLPGLTTDERSQNIDALVRSYYEEPHNVVLCVVQAHVDRGQSQSFRVRRELLADTSSNMERLVTVYSKCDLIYSDDAGLRGLQGRLRSEAAEARQSRTFYCAKHEPPNMPDDFGRDKVGYTEVLKSVEATFISKLRSALQGASREMGARLRQVDKDLTEVKKRGGGAPKIDNITHLYELVNQLSRVMSLANEGKLNCRNDPHFRFQDRTDIKFTYKDEYRKKMAELDKDLRNLVVPMSSMEMSSEVQMWMLEKDGWAPLEAEIDLLLKEADRNNQRIVHYQRKYGHVLAAQYKFDLVEMTQENLTRLENLKKAGETPTSQTRKLQRPPVRVLDDWQEFHEQQEDGQMDVRYFNARTKHTTTDRSETPFARDLSEAQMRTMWLDPTSVVVTALEDPKFVTYDGKKRLEKKEADKADAIAEDEMLKSRDVLIKKHGTIKQWLRCDRDRSLQSEESALNLCTSVEGQCLTCTLEHFVDCFRDAQLKIKLDEESEGFFEVLPWLWDEITEQLKDDIRERIQDGSNRVLDVLKNIEQDAKSLGTGGEFERHPGVHSFEDLQVSIERYFYEKTAKYIAAQDDSRSPGTYTFEGACTRVQLTVSSTDQETAAAADHFGSRFLGSTRRVIGAAAVPGAARDYLDEIPISPSFLEYIKQVRNTGKLPTQKDIKKEVIAEAVRFFQAQYRLDAMGANLRRAKDQLSELIESDASQRDALLTSWHIMRTGLQVLHRTFPEVSEIGLPPQERTQSQLDQEQEERTLGDEKEQLEESVKDLNRVLKRRD